MSVVFLLLGLVNLIILFYEKDKLSKIFLCVSLSFSLLSFFAGDLIFHTLEFNIFLLFMSIEKTEKTEKFKKNIFILVLDNLRGGVVY